MKINIYYILFHKFIYIYNIKKKERKKKKNIFLNHPLEYTITFNVILHLLLDYNAQAL